MSFAFILLPVDSKTGARTATRTSSMLFLADVSRWPTLHMNLIPRTINATLHLVNMTFTRKSGSRTVYQDIEDG